MGGHIFLVISLCRFVAGIHVVVSLGVVLGVEERREAALFQGRSSLTGLGGLGVECWLGLMQDVAPALHWGRMAHGYFSFA